MQAEDLLKIATETIDEHKGQKMTVLDVRNKASFTDYMIVVTGTSDRHLHALCSHVSDEVKKNGFNPYGIEGGFNTNWVLLDLGDVIVHAMTQEGRDYYQLEKLWSVEVMSTNQQQTA